SASLTPKNADSPFAEAAVRATSGETILANTASGPATALLTPSASARAMRLGTSSPTPMLRYDTASVMSAGASQEEMAESQPTPKPESHAASGSERFVAAA